MNNFIIYEKVREAKEGGGIAIGAKKELNPVLIAEGNSEVEAISIDIHPSKITISCTSAYGPQEHDSLQKKSRFWEYLDNIVEIAWKEGKGFYLQGDLNAWLGCELIPCKLNFQNQKRQTFPQFSQQASSTKCSQLTPCV